jgi:hypothetical protein
MDLPTNNLPVIVQFNYWRIMNPQNLPHMWKPQGTVRLSVSCIESTQVMWGVVVSPRQNTEFVEITMKSGNAWHVLKRDFYEVEGVDMWR